MASEAERAILDLEILRPVGETKLRRSAEKELVGFLAMKGTLYNGKLMVVGRALNGGDRISLSDLASPSECTQHSREVFQKSNGNGVCPMQWLIDGWKAGKECPGYNIRRSAFFRVLRQVVERLGIVEERDFEDTWASHLVWSNLCKVSPADGGNPGEILYKAQRSGCKKLLDHEIETYKPERLLFLTGWRNWAEDFLPEKDMQPFDGKGFVERSGSLALSSGIRTRVAVAVHPQVKKQGKKEADWVNEVVSLLR